MSAENNVNEPSTQGLFLWQPENLVAATLSVNGQWQQNQAVTEGVSSYRIATDTRTIKAGDIFLALVGDNFNGHDYVAAALEQGAVAAIVSELVAADIPQLVVDDTRLALGQLAAYRRQQHPDITIIALTGSSGKTTCKEMLGSIFSRLAPTLITRGNLNNDLGVPMMMLELSDQHKYAILELGANHLGEIAYTSHLVQPDVACILNIGTAHLGEFGSRELICQAKAEIYETLTDQQYAIIPDQDDFTQELRDAASAHTTNILGFGRTDVTASHMEVESSHSSFNLYVGDERASVTLPLVGEHNINNALAAAACAHAVGIGLEDIVVGLKNARPAKGRLNSQLLGVHRLIDDTYNANPHSVRAAAKVLASQTGVKVMVLGDIAELGEASAAEHLTLGRDIAALDVDVLYGVGEFAPFAVEGALEVGRIDAKAFEDKTALLTELKQLIAAHEDQPCTLLFKGSRTMKMETLIDALVEE